MQTPILLRPILHMHVTTMLPDGAPNKVDSGVLSHGLVVMPKANCQCQKPTAESASITSNTPCRVPHPGYEGVLIKRAWPGGLGSVDASSLYQVRMVRGSEVTSLARSRTQVKSANRSSMPDQVTYLRQQGALTITQALSQAGSGSQVEVVP